MNGREMIPAGTGGVPSMDASFSNGFRGYSASFLCKPPSIAVPSGS